jgi:hypothetical protein
MAVPKKVEERICSALKHLIPVVQQQRTRDVSEADTVTLVKDLLSDAFGYDKYADLTSELAIRGTYCDLGIRIEDRVTQLVEVKAIGITLTDRHVKQGVDYAANQGIEWVVLTNAVTWRLYHVIFAKPIDKRLIAELDITACNLRKDADLESLYLFTKEGFRKGVHVDLRDRQDATSRFLVAALLIGNENVIATIRRELRRIVDILVPDEDIVRVLRDEIIKRDALEGPPAEQAAGRVRRADARRGRDEATPTDSAPAIQATGTTVERLATAPTSPPSAPAL